MLISLFRRWFGNKPGAPASTPPEPVRSAAAAAPRAMESASDPVVGARRPLVDAKGEIAGYEFHISQAQQQRLRERADTTATRAQFNALLGSMRRCAASGSIAYAELPAYWLALAPAEAAQGLQLALHTLNHARDDDVIGSWLTAWRGAGARIGWRDTESIVAGIEPDFRVCSDASTSRAGTWVAPDLPDVDALEAALQAGARWAASAVKIGTEPRAARIPPPQARHLMQLLNRLVRDDDTAAVVDEIKQDAALSVRLLQYLNSPGVSRGQTLESIEQAVALLGRDALYHWVSGMLVRLAPPRQAAAGLQALALSRARQLEMLGRAAGEAVPGSLYLMGLASVLPLLLHTTLADALSSLQLPINAERALLSRDGPWANYLNLVEALEDSDMVVATVLARPLGGIDAVMAIAAKSWMPD